MRWIGAAVVLGLLAGGAIWAATRGDDDQADTGGAPTTSAAVVAAAAAAPDPDAAAASGSPVPTGTGPAPAAVAPRTFSGTIDTVDEEERHVLDLVDGQLLYLGGERECGPQLQYRLLAPDGSQLGTTQDVCRDLGRVAVDRTGTWTVVIDSWGGTGPYAVALAPIRSDLLATLPDGAPVTGEIVDRGELHRYRFTGAANDRVYIAGEPVSSSCTDVAYRLYTPAGQTVGGEPFVCQDIGLQILPSTGDYELRVYSWNGGVGTYGATLFRVPTVRTEDVVVGATVSGEITVPGEEVDYHFSADAGTVLHVVGSGPSTTGVAFSLRDPGGVRYGPEPYAFQPGDFTVPASGTQTLAVYSYGGGIGAYEITIDAG